MIVSIYIIGSTFALLVLAGKLREARHELRRVTWQRDAYAQALQAPGPGDRYALPPAGIRAGYPDGPDE